MVKMAFVVVGWTFAGRTLCGAAKSPVVSPDRSKLDFFEHVSVEHFTRQIFGFPVNFL